MENNKAFIATLNNITPIEGADKIVKAWVTLENIPQASVVVGKETKEGTKVVYFDSNLALKQEVINIIDENSPDHGKEGFVSIGNYLARGNRVRCIKLRGTISNGLSIEIEKFYPFFSNAEKAEKTLVEGYAFDKIGGTEICEKWLPKTRQRGGPNLGKKGKKAKEESRMIPNHFHFHVDTDQLLRNVHKLHPDHIYSISRKIHGTSAICGKVLVKRKLGWYEKVLKKLGVNINDTEYDHIYASRKVIKNDAENLGYYNVDLWTEAGQKYFLGKLRPSETVYYEIVGYLPNSDKMIQKDYDYGCKPGEYKIAVYRITTTLPDGSVIDYNWDQIKERCKQMDVPMVEEYYYGKGIDCPVGNHDDTIKDWQYTAIEYLKDHYLEKDALDCKKKVPDEGIVVRDFSTLGIEVFKLKSDKFTLKESKNKENEVEDIEEEQ